MIDPDGRPAVVSGTLLASGTIVLTLARTWSDVVVVDVHEKPRKGGEATVGVVRGLCSDAIFDSATLRRAPPSQS